MLLSQFEFIYELIDWEKVRNDNVYSPVKELDLKVDIYIHRVYTVSWRKLVTM